MMVMNEEAMRFLVGLNPRAWRVRCADIQMDYKNRSADVAAMANDWQEYKITHLSMPEKGIIAIWLDGEDK